MLYGFGGRLLLFPDTIVTPAISVDLGYTESSSDVDGFSLRTSQFQGAALVSKQFSHFELYSGFRISPQNSKLKSTNEEFYGKRDNFAFFLGLQRRMRFLGKLIFEVSLGDEKFFSGGITSQF